MRRPVFVSLVAYLRNRGDEVVAFLEAADRFLSESFAQHEIVIVDDGSTDDPGERIRGVTPHLSGPVTFIELARRHGVEVAMTAGLHRAIGDFVIEIESASPHFDPVLLVDLYDRAARGTDIVTLSSRRTSRRSRLFYWVVNRYSNLGIELGTDNARVVSRRALNAMLALQERVRYRKALYALTGFPHERVFYEPVGAAGGSRSGTREGFLLAFDVLISFSSVGLRLAHALSLVFLAVSLLITVYAVIVYIFFEVVSGWTTMMVFLSLSLAGVFLIMGLIGEYVARVLMEVQHRPLYAVRSTNTYQPDRHYELDGPIGTAPEILPTKPAASDRVPWAALDLQHDVVAQEVADGWVSVLSRSAFVLGEEVGAFEAAYAAFGGIQHCLSVANGTDALELILRAAGIGPGDEVIVPANSFAASALAVQRAGAIPRLADVDDETLLLAPESVAANVGPRTRAIMPVHLYGQMAPMDPLLSLAAERDLLVVEDAAQAQGAEQAGATPGSRGSAAGSSFYPSKNLGAYGDAGAVLTNDAAIAASVVELRNYGGGKKYEHSKLGFNSRLDTLQAVVLLAKLRHLPKWNKERRMAAARYDELLSGVAGVRTPSTAPENTHCWHMYIVRVPARDRVADAMHAAGIDVGVHYPTPIHLLPAFSSLNNGPGTFPVAEAAAREVLSLPIFPGITPAQQERVVDALRRALR